MPRYRLLELIACCIAGAGLLVCIGSVLTGAIEPSSQMAVTVLMVAGGCGMMLIVCQIRHYFVLARTETEHEKELEARRERGNTLKAIFDHAPIDMYLKDAEGRYSWINRYSEELFGVTNDEIKGKLPTEFHISRRGEQSRKQDLRVLEFGDVVTVEEEVATTNGDRILQIIKFPIFDDNREIRGLGAIASDITDMKNAEATIRESTQRFNAILQNAPVAIHLKDLEGRYVVINQAFEDMFSYSKDEILGHTLTELQGDNFGPDHLEKIADAERKVVQTGLPQMFEIELDVLGEVRVLDFVKFPVMDENGVVLGVGGIEIDVTERQHTEQAIRESEERFRDFSQAGSDWYWELDKNLCYSFLAIGARDAPAYPVDDIIGMHRADNKPEGIDETIWLAHLDDLNAHRPFRDFIQPRQLGDGNVIWLSVHGVPLVDDNGDFAGYRGTGVDITKSRNAERRIRESEARLQALFDNASEGMFFKDIDSRYEMVNTTFANRIGFDNVDQVVGKTVFELYPEGDAELYRLDDVACMASREISTKELEIPLPNGTELVQFAIKFPIISTDGLVVGVGGIDVDITERKNLERMKNEFTSTVSHELRTPLTSIKGSLGLVVDGALGDMPDAAGSMVDIAYKNTNRLINLVNDVLDVEKIASGNMVYDFRRLDLSELVEQSIRADQDYIEVHGERHIVTDTTEVVMVNGDSARLGQVIANLLSNAIKFSSEGEKIEIAVSTSQNGLAQVSITDHGDGIPEAYQAHIFERFTQADGSDTRQKGGTGLGLNISKTIVEKHGGTIDFHSEVGVGSTFFFTIPVWQDDQS